MLSIRMRRAGSKKRVHYRVVVTEGRTPREGSFVEVLGHYYPRTQPAKIDVNRERVDYWLAQGARPSDTVRTLLARHVPPAPTADAAAAAPATK